MIKFTRARYYLSDKGIQEKTSQLIIAPSELQEAYNVHFYENGSWTKRAGSTRRYTNAITGSPIVTGLYELIQRNGTTRFITSADKLYLGNQGDTDPSTIAGGLTFTTGSEGENLMSMITFNNKAIGANGVENIWQYDATTAATLSGSPPISKVISVFNNFIFAAGNSTYPYRLYFSNDGDETTWDAADYIDIGDLTSPITTLAVLYGKLYVFTRRAMFELRGFDRDTFQVNEVTLSTGCVGVKAVVKIDNNLVFWSDRGIYSFDGINVHYLSQNLQTTLEGLNYGRLPYIVAELYKAKNQVWFSTSTGSNSSNNQIICMTYKPTQAEQGGITEENVAFAVYTGLAFNAFGIERSESSLDRLYGGGYTGLVFHQDVGTSDDGVGIAFKVKTPPIDMGAPEEFKRFRYIQLFNKQEGAYGLDISYSTDFGLGGSTSTIQLLVDASLWGTLIWGVGKWGGTTIIRNRVGFKASGHFMELTFTNSNADQPIVIKGFTMLAQMKGVGR
jgi:hypothetical protein